MKGILIDNDGDLIIDDNTDYYQKNDKDFLKNTNKVTKGLSIDDNTGQTVQLTLVCMPGEAKADPEAGVGVKRYMGGQSSPFFEGEIVEQLKRQLIDATSIAISEEGVSIEY